MKRDIDICPLKILSPQISVKIGLSPSLMLNKKQFPLFINGFYSQISDLRMHLQKQSHSKMVFNDVTGK